VRAILLSLFGGGTHVDRVARNLIDILGKREATKPVVLRLHGTGREEATRILGAAGLENHESLEKAVAEAVARAREA
jgi:succinyl-CoA synthetase beta subunit